MILKLRKQRQLKINNENIQNLFLFKIIRIYSFPQIFFLRNLHNYKLFILKEYHFHSNKFIYLFIYLTNLNLTN